MTRQPIEGATLVPHGWRSDTDLAGAHIRMAQRVVDRYAHDGKHALADEGVYDDRSPGRFPNPAPELQLKHSCGSLVVNVTKIG